MRLRIRPMRPRTRSRRAIPTPCPRRTRPPTRRRRRSLIPSRMSPPTSRVDLAAVRTDIQTQLGITDALPLETDALLNLYGIDSSWVAQSASFVTMAGTFPDEVILVEAVDEDRRRQHPGKAPEPAQRGAGPVRVL